MSYQFMLQRARVQGPNCLRTADREAADTHHPGPGNSLSQVDSLGVLLSVSLPRDRSIFAHSDLDMNFFGEVPAQMIFTARVL